MSRPLPVRPHRAGLQEALKTKPWSTWSELNRTRNWKQTLIHLLQTTHFKLLNAISLALFEEDMLDPLIRQDLKTGQGWQFHADLMMSGMDRLLVVSLPHLRLPTLLNFNLCQTVRKASVDFYPHFHLEVARFVRHAIDANLKLPYPVQRLLGPPCEKYRRRVSGTPAGRAGARAADAPWLPLSGSIGALDLQS